MKTNQKKLFDIINAFSNLLEKISSLRDKEKGCPWLNDQTHESLEKYVLEEAYEVRSAIRNKNDNNLKEELGDLLLQVLLHSQIADDNRSFTLKDVIRELEEKIIERNPHIFGDVKIKNAKEAKAMWEEIKDKQNNYQNIKTKLSEKIKRKIDSQSSLSGANEICKNLPKTIFTKDYTETIINKINININNLQESIQKNNTTTTIHIYGQLLFDFIHIGSLLNISPDNSLLDANKRFINIFYLIEEHIENNFGKNRKDDILKIWEAGRSSN